MTIAQYRASARREWLQKLLESPEWKEVAGIMEQTGPAHIALSPNISPHGAYIELGKRQGYTLYPDMLTILSTKLEDTTADVESKYREET